MNQIYIKGRAKINLALDIVGKRDDGYHQLSTIMQTMTLCDSLLIKKIQKPDYLKVISNLPWLPNDQRNLAWQAARYLIDRFAIPDGIFISINKAIPASAGLGGGSADCAATLLGIRNLFGLPISNEEIKELSVRFGADVPFCVMQGCAHAGGIGEELSPLPPLPPMYVLLVKPNVIVSTEDVFKRYDPEKVAARPDVDKVIHNIHKGNLAGICENIANVLESVSAVRYPIIDDIKAVMTENGALTAMMTGSGPTVFGIFKTRKAARGAADAVKATYPRINEIFVTKPYYPKK